MELGSAGNYLFSPTHRNVFFNMDKKWINKKIEGALSQALNQTCTSIKTKQNGHETIVLSDESTNTGIRFKVRSGISKQIGKPRRSKTFAKNGARDELRVALIYQNRPIGEIELQIDEDGMDLDEIRNSIERVALDIVFHLKRRQVSKELNSSRNMNVEWIGESKSSREVDKFVEKASAVSFPVLLNGPVGSGKWLTAYSIHCLGTQQKGSFVESHCTNWPEQEVATIMRRLWKKAKRGTLYLRQIDALNSQQLRKIRHYWRDIVNTESHGGQVPPRIIASIGRQNSHQVKHVFEELNYLTFDLPLLKDRREDIKDLTQHYIEKLAYINQIQLAPECWELFEQFSWRGNIAQLEQVVAKLVVMSESKLVDSNQLLAIIPELKDAQGETINFHDDSQELLLQPDPMQIATSFVNNEYVSCADIHPSLSKALDYLSENYLHNVTLGMLSDNAFVSPSHLSYLFKSELNCSFKQLLIQARIEKAKMLLVQEKYSRITEIAYDVGFHDLSHFEKTFKRLVGCSPGKFRKSL